MKTLHYLQHFMHIYKSKFTHLGYTMSLYLTLSLSHTHTHTHTEKVKYIYTVIHLSYTNGPSPKLSYQWEFCPSNVGQQEELALPKIPQRKSRETGEAREC